MYFPKVVREKETGCKIKPHAHKDIQRTKNKNKKDACPLPLPSQPKEVALLACTGNRTVHCGILPLEHVKTAVDFLGPKHVFCATNDQCAFAAALRPPVTYVRANACDHRLACLGLFTAVLYKLNIRYPDDYEWMAFDVEEWMTWVD